jgi:hypothetical protein
MSLDEDAIRKVNEAFEKATGTKESLSCAAALTSQHHRESP